MLDEHESKNLVVLGSILSQRWKKKKSFSATSYGHDVKQSRYLSSHDPAYERELLRLAGIFLDAQLGETSISDGCRKLCTVWVSAKYEPPENSLFEADLLWKVVNGASIRSKARVVRDISPWLIPSPELLFMCGIPGLQNLTEETQAE